MWKDIMITSDDLKVNLNNLPHSEAYPLLHRYGAVILQNVLDLETCEKMKGRIDEIFEDPHFQRTRNAKGGKDTPGQERRE